MLNQTNQTMKKVILLFVAMTVSVFTFAQMNSGHQTNAPAPIMVQSQIVPALNGTCNFLVLQDNLPWGSSAITNILTANGETFSVANSATFPGMDFSPYDVIIVASDQVPAFHTVFAANFGKFQAFVQAGGSLEVHAATCGWNSPCGYSVQLPGGVFTVEEYDFYNLVADPTNPIVTGVSSPFYGNYASHGYFSNLVAGTEIITTAQTSGRPTTIQYHFGAGVVTATCCTYEFGYNNGQQAGTMLVNNLNYACNHAIAAIPTMTEWGLIILGLALLGFGTFYILRMKA